VSSLVSPFNEPVNAAFLFCKGHLCTNQRECSFAFTVKPAANPVPGASAVEKTIIMKKELLDALEKLGSMLPPNTLDELIDELGGPDCVAEVRSLICLCKTSSSHLQ
jgi:hypothetical protein